MWFVRRDVVRRQTCETVFAGTSCQDHEFGDFVLKPANRARRAPKLQRWVNAWPSQMILFALALVIVMSYQMKQTEEVPSDYVFFVSSATIVLFLLTVCELIVRIAAQGGPLRLRSSWSRFFSLFFHKFEMAFICIYLIWVVRCLQLAHRLMNEGEIATNEDFNENHRSVVVIIGLRLQRMWGIWFNINVKDEERRRKARSSKNRFLWMREHVERIELRNKELLVSAEGYVDSLPAQLTIALLVLFQAIFDIVFSRSMEGLRGVYAITKWSGYFLLLVYMLEFMVRCAAQGGFEQFLSPTVHKVEIVTCIFGTYALGNTVWFHNARASGERDFHGLWAYSWGALLMLHRSIRAFEIRQGVSASDTASENFADVLARKAFTTFTGAILRIAPENVFIRFMMPSDLTLRLHKAELNGEALRDLHLPIAVRGGLAEELNLSMKVGLKGRAEVVVKVENALLLLAPGGGLAEAGGVQPASDYWNPETVREAKSNLVEIICHHITPHKDGKDAVDSSQVDEMNHSGRARRWRAMGQYFERLRKKLTDELLKNTTVDIKNVRVQMDDSEGSLGLGHVTLGAKVGSIKCLRKQGTASIHRLGVFVQMEHHREKERPERNELSRKKSNATIKSRQSWNSWAAGHFQSSFSGTSSATEANFGENMLKYIMRSPFRLTEVERQIDQDPWVDFGVPKLHYLLQEHPKLALAELVRQNHVERWRLWAFEELEKQLPTSSDRQRYARLQRYPERHLVFSLLRLECTATSEGKDQSTRPQRATIRTTSLNWSRNTKAPEADPAASHNSQQSRGRESVLLEDANTGKKWTWSVKIPDPVRFHLHEDQLAAMMTVMHSVQSWRIHDSAMKWWPGLRLCDIEADHPPRGIVRHTVARMWWMYAVHRVLAQKHKRATSMMMDAMWQGMNFSHYKDLLRDMSHHRRPHGGTIPNASLEALQPYKAERKQVKDLQLLLPLSDILLQRRRAISQNQRSSLSGRSSAGLQSGSMSWGSATSSSLPGFLRKHYQGRRSSSSVGNSTMSFNVRSHDFFTEDLTRSMSPSARSSTPEMSSTASKSHDLVALAHFQGDWELDVPLVELVVLTGRRQKTRLLHGKVENACMDVRVLPEEQPSRRLSSSGLRHSSCLRQTSSSSPGRWTGLEEQEVPDKPCLVAFSVDSFALTSPDGCRDFRGSVSASRAIESREDLLLAGDGRDLLYGAPPEVVGVVRPLGLELGESRSRDIELARNARRRVDHPVALAVFASVDPSDRSGECEVHVADLRVLVTDLLLQRLHEAADPMSKLEKMRRQSTSRPSCWADSPRHVTSRTSLASSRPAANNSTASIRPTGTPLTSFFSAGAAATPKVEEAQDSSPRSAAFIDRVEYNSSNASYDSDASTAGSESVDQSSPEIKEIRRIHLKNRIAASIKRNQKLFEFATRMAAPRGGIDIRYHVGAVQMVHMSEYLEKSVCVKQTRFSPFTFNDEAPDAASKQAQAEWGGNIDLSVPTAPPRGPARFTWEFNGDVEGCLQASEQQEASSSSSESCSPRKTGGRADAPLSAREMSPWRMLQKTVQKTSSDALSAALSRSRPQQDNGRSDRPKALTSLWGSNINPDFDGERLRDRPSLETCTVSLCILPISSVAAPRSWIRAQDMEWRNQMLPWHLEQEKQQRRRRSLLELRRQSDESDASRTNESDNLGPGSRMSL